MFRKCIVPLVALAISTGFASSAAADDGASARLTVMTRNLYVGSSFTHAVTATTPGEFVQGVSQIWSNVRRTDFRTRAKALATEIARTRPDMIGLQEVSLWEKASGSQPLHPVADYLQILLGELDARGLAYTPATVSTGFTVTAPAIEDGQLITLRLTDRDAILVNTDSPRLEISNASSGTFAARLTLATAVGPVPVPRTWTMVDGDFRARPFRLVSTHLDPDSPAVQVQQAQELLSGPYDTARALIAVGDFNSAADGSSTDTYGLLTGAGLADAWEGDGEGLTCCQAELLDNTTSQLSERIDLVMTRSGLRATDADVVGERSKDRIAGLWPSDHAGVVAELKLQDLK
jgi:endonuclease/exonuclease/phosphatase family metal-dependent hydrolase